MRSDAADMKQAATSRTGRAPRIAHPQAFDAAALTAELAAMATLARMQQPASLAGDLSTFAGITGDTAPDRPGAALRHAHTVRLRFSMERLRDYRALTQAGDDAARHRLRNTIEILAASLRRAVAMSGEGSQASADAPGEAIRSRAA